MAWTCRWPARHCRRACLPAACRRRRADRAVRARALLRRPARTRQGGLSMAIAILFVRIRRCCWSSACRWHSRCSAASLATVLYLGLPPIVVVQQIAAGAGSASLIAIPLFIFAGELMMRGGISDRLIALRRLAGRPHARRPRPGQRAVVAVLRRRVRFGHRRCVGGRRHDDPADGQARFRPRFRGQRLDHRRAGGAAGAAVAQPDPVSRRRPAASFRSPTCSPPASCRRC